MSIAKHGLLPRRSALILGGAAATLAAPLAAPAIGQEVFPNRPIRMICPWPAGGSSDIQIRSICEIASAKLGQPIAVENRPGAGGILGAQTVRNAPADGYLLTQFPITVFRQPHMVDQPLFNPMEDFSFIVHITGYLFGIAVRSDSPFQSFQQVIEHARANPGALTYGTPGVGTTLHITMEQITSEAGVEMLHVPFRGFADNGQALLGGQIDMLADSSAWAPLVLDGRMRLLVVWSQERARRFPDVPTLTEIGIPLVQASPYGYGGRAGIPEERQRIIHDAFAEALMDPAHIEVLNRFDMSPWHMNTADYTAFARQQYETEGAMVRRLGLRM